MNCDHAFDLMTDPVLDDSAELHAHLDECPRCRQMYETLAPALGLFSSTASAWNGDQTVRDESAMAGGVEIARRVAVRLAQDPAPPAAASRQRTRGAWACLAASALVLVSAIGLTALQPATPSAPAETGRCTWLNREAVGAEQRAEAVVLSCVACHAAQQQLRQDLTSVVTPRWTEWSVTSLAKVQPVMSFDDPAWLRWAIWPTERAAHT